MKVVAQRDKANDQVYLSFAHGALTRGGVHQTIRATDSIALDFDKAGRLLGIDIDSASKVLGRRALSDRPQMDELVGVAEAAKLCGVRKPNFLRDIAGKPDFPQPVADLASGRIWLRSDVESYLASHRKSVARLRRIA